MAFKLAVTDNAVSRSVTCEINGMPGIRLVIGEMIFAVVTFDYLQDQLSNVYVVMNPEKLSHFNRMK